VAVVDIDLAIRDSQIWRKIARGVIAVAAVHGNSG
jgi:hypothetical protein